MSARIEALKDLVAEFEQQAERIKVLRQALAPFSNVALDYEEAFVRQIQVYADEGKKAPGWSDSHKVSVSLGDCRKAYEALTCP